MAWSLDARVPVVSVPDAGALDALSRSGGPAALLLPEPFPPGAPLPSAAAREGFALSALHVAACTCCGGRPPAATALDRLFQRRLRGTALWFDRVLALTENDAVRAAVAAALRDDAVTRARFREG